MTEEFKLRHYQKFAKSYGKQRLREFAENGMFVCHKTAELREDEETAGFHGTPTSQVCAGMLIYNEKREQPNQMMRICERLGQYDYRKLNMESPVI